MNGTLDDYDLVALAIEAKYDKHEISRKCSIGVRQLERYCHRRFGQTPRNWIDLIRLTKAREMIQQNIPVKVVAVEVGFKSPQHFSRKYKALHGYPPTRTPRPR